MTVFFCFFFFFVSIGIVIAVHAKLIANNSETSYEHIIKIHFLCNATKFPAKQNKKNGYQFAGGTIYAPRNADDDQWWTAERACERLEFIASVLFKELN